MPHLFRRAYNGRRGLTAIDARKVVVIGWTYRPVAGGSTMAACMRLIAGLFVVCALLSQKLFEEKRPAASRWYKLRS